MLTKCSEAFKQSRIAERVKSLALGLLTCYGRHTVTGMLTASGQHFRDWSSAYRIFCNQRVDIQKLFRVSIKEVLVQLPADQMLIAHMDDTLIRKTGKTIPGTAWRRDPLGPPFQTNFIWGQRFLQISMALGDSPIHCQSRAIPVDFHHCPTVKKPGKTSDVEAITRFKEQQNKAKLSVQGVQRIKALREELDRHGAGNKPLYISVDGSYTNEAVLKNLPQGVFLIGRIRKDAKLYTLAQLSKSTGRKKVYGEQIPTPEQIRQSDQIPWENVTAWATGKSHEFGVKIIRNLKSRSAGMKHELQLIVIKPLGYRLTKESKLLYRQPVYLICTDNGLEIEKLLQAYLWRWEIEVNFRDEKTLLGCGQAQVRNPESVKSIPAFTVAMFAFMLLAAHRTHKNRNESMLPKAKWDPVKNQQRITSSEMVNLLRAQTWLQNDKVSFSGFVYKEHENKRLKNMVNPAFSAMFYARK